MHLAVIGVNGDGVAIATELRIGVRRHRCRDGGGVGGVAAVPVVGVDGELVCLTGSVGRVDEKLPPTRPTVPWAGWVTV